MGLEAIAWAMASEGSFSIQKVRNSLQPVCLDENGVVVVTDGCLQCPMKVQCELRRKTKDG